MARHWPGKATVVEFKPREFSCFEAFRRVLYSRNWLSDDVFGITGFVLVSSID
jgi:hypothetical protein